jgi:hypothetical protein
MAAQWRCLGCRPGRDQLLLELLDPGGDARVQLLLLLLHKGVSLMLRRLCCCLGRTCVGACCCDRGAALVQ